MRIKDGFELREICGEHVILSHGMDNIDFSKIISLNETAAFLWKEVVGKEEISEEELTATLLEAYEVDEETARNSPFSMGSCQWYFTANVRMDMTMMAERMALTSA